MAKMRKSRKESPVQLKKKERAYVSQGDVPKYGLEEALRVVRVIVEQYGGKSTPPLQVAEAMQMQPGSSSFRMLCGAATAYGLTTGGAWADAIGITDLGKRILAPLEEGDDVNARRQAVVKPRVISAFLGKYDKLRFPGEDIAVNVLASMGVPKNRAKAVLDLIVREAQSLGLIREIKQKKYVDLRAVEHGLPVPPEDGTTEGELTTETDVQDLHRAGQETPLTRLQPVIPGVKEPSRRVLVAHGKKRDFVEPIKKLLAFGELEPVVCVERQSVSQPVPDKVMDDMRSCGAAIIHVDPDRKLIDEKAEEHIVLNPNVLIEIGAAMALYGRRFILLVKEGVDLPSNLQGLFTVRYSGDQLDGEVTIGLLEAINDMKKRPMPGLYAVPPKQ